MVCQEKHMDSRAVALIDRDLEAARARFTAPGALGAGLDADRPAVLTSASWSTSCAKRPNGLRIHARCPTFTKLR